MENLSNFWIFIYFAERQCASCGSRPSARKWYPGRTKHCSSSYRRTHALSNFPWYSLPGKCLLSFLLWYDRKLKFQKKIRFRLDSGEWRILRCLVNRFVIKWMASTRENTEYVAKISTLHKTIKLTNQVMPTRIIPVTKPLRTRRYVEEPSAGGRSLYTVIHAETFRRNEYRTGG